MNPGILGILECLAFVEFLEFRVCFCFGGGGGAPRIATILRCPRLLRLLNNRSILRSRVFPELLELLEFVEFLGFSRYSEFLDFYGV